jgi:hypothetical protein
VPTASDKSRGARLLAGGKQLVRSIQEDDDALLESLQRLSRSRRLFAPLAFMIGAFALLFDGLKVLLSNWRLTLVQILPAVWIWLAMFDLKLHVLHGKSFHDIRGAILIPIFLAIIAITIASFFLNAVFAFAIAGPRPALVRPAVTVARAHLRTIAASGTAVGLLLAIATMISPRWDRPWFAVTLGAVVGLMMIVYVAVPARLIGATTVHSSRRDKLASSALSGAIGATVCTPPYVLGRVGLLMLGTQYLLIPGIFVFALGVTLQAGATGAVRAVKLSTRLTAATPHEQLADERLNG